MGVAFTKINHKSSSTNHVNFKVVQGQKFLRHAHKNIEQRQCYKNFKFEKSHRKSMVNLKSNISKTIKGKNFLICYY